MIILCYSALNCNSNLCLFCPGVLKQAQSTSKHLFYFIVESTEMTAFIGMWVTEIGLSGSELYCHFHWKLDTTGTWGVFETLWYANYVAQQIVNLLSLSLHPV